jgi:hypothetical protein
VQCVIAHFPSHVSIHVSVPHDCLFLSNFLLLQQQRLVALALFMMLEAVMGTVVFAIRCSLYARLVIAIWPARTSPGVKE